MKKKQKGQALIAVLLIMAAALTLALATSQQVSTDLKMSRQQEESAKALAAAEAGIEKALGGNLGNGQFTLDNNLITAVTSKTIGNSRGVIWPQEQRPGQGLVFWLVNHDSQGNLGSRYYQGRLNVYWRPYENGQPTPALVLALFYRRGQALKYWAYDPQASRRQNNKFSVPSTGHFTVSDSQQGISQTFLARVSLNLASYSQPMFLWVRSFYQAAGIGFSGSSNLPIQGHLYISAGEVGPTAAPEITSRRLQAFKTFAQPPAILLESLTSFGRVEAVSQ